LLARMTCAYAPYSSFFPSDHVSRPTLVSLRRETRTYAPPEVKFKIGFVARRDGRRWRRQRRGDIGASCLTRRACAPYPSPAHATRAAVLRSEALAVLGHSHRPGHTLALSVVRIACCVPAPQTHCAKIRERLGGGCVRLRNQYQSVLMVILLRYRRVHAQGIWHAWARVEERRARSGGARVSTRG